MRPRPAIEPAESSPNRQRHERTDRCESRRSKGTPDRGDDGSRRGESSARLRADKTRPPTRSTRSSGPQRLSEIIGQRAVAERLEISLAAAKKRGEPLPHILFDGPPGLGKTTFATVLHNELGVELNITSGAALDKKMDVMPFLTNAAEGSILFIDEIHRLPRAVEEFIYPVMEDFRVDVVLGEGMSARTINLPLKKFTIIGATTRSGMLSGPLRERFGMHEHLEFYDADDLARIITINAAKLRSTHRRRGRLGAGRAQPRDASDRQRPPALGPRLRPGPRRRAHQSVGRPRRARHAGGRRRGARQARPPLPRDPDPRLRAAGPTGVEALAATMNVSVDTLKDEVEPYLLRREFVVRSPRGRQVDRGGLSPPGASRTLRPSRMLSIVRFPATAVRLTRWPGAISSPLGKRTSRAQQAGRERPATRARRAA